MYQGSGRGRSPTPRRGPPPVSVSVVFGILLVGGTSALLAAVNTPALAVAFGAGALTAVGVHVARTRSGSRDDDYRSADTSVNDFVSRLAR
jgi:hypothetical protein